VTKIVVWVYDQYLILHDHLFFVDSLGLELILL
jgi:hypothetical protein